MLSQFLLSQLFAFLLVFCRLGSALMLMPGFGEAYVSARIRLGLAAFFSIIMSQVLAPLPAAPTALSGLLHLLLAEIIIGLFIGGMGRLLISTTNVAGSIIAYQSSLTSSLTQNVTSFQGQDTTVSNLLSFTAVVLMFVTDLHHIALQGLADSYTLFMPGQFPKTEDIADHAARIMGETFAMAMQLAAPNIVIGLMIYLGGGILSRLMPALQIFFVLQAPQLLLSFFIIMVSFPAFMLWFMDYYRNHLNAFVSP